jgi:hypothetical protein
MVLHVLFSQMMGLLALLFTDMISCCLNEKVMCRHAYAKVVQTFVSFVCNVKYGMT